MGVYTIQTPDGRKVKIEAADEATAIRGAQEWAKANTPSERPKPARPKGDGSPEKPYDLSGGQSRAGLPKGVYYLDREQNLRRNDNADRGNPIIVPAGKRSDANPFGVDVAGDAPAKRGQSRSPLAEAQGAINNFYRTTGVLDEGQAAFNALSGLVSGQVQPRRAEGDLNAVPGYVRGVGDRFRNSLAWARGSEDDFAARRPLVAGAAKGAGLTATMIVPGGAPSQLATAPSRFVGALRGAAVGGAQAYAYGLADRGTLSERFDQGARNVPLGAGLGAVVGAITTPGRPKPVAREELDALQARAPVDVNAARAAAGEYRGVGIDPAMVDVVDDSGRGLVRATAGKMTPGRQAATDFADARALDLPDRIGGQARRLISPDPRTPDQIRAALTAQRGTAADQAFGAVRDARLTMDPDTIMALRSPDGRAAIRSAANDSLNSLDPAERALAAELNRLAESAIDDPSTQITVGMAQSISKSLLDAADVASRGGRNNSARILGGLGRAIRDNAEQAVPAYGAALKGYAADSRMIEAADVGEQFMSRNTDEFGAAMGQMDPAQREIARAAARRAVERKAGESTSAAPGVARRLSTAPEQKARNVFLLGDQGADDFQNALRLEGSAVRNANDIAPRAGSQTQLRSQDAERAEKAVGTMWKVIKQDWMGLAGDWLRSFGIKDPVAQQLTETAIDPAALDDALLYLEQRYGPQAAQAFQQYRSQAIINATRAERAAGLVAGNTNSQPQNALATSPR